MSPVLDHFWVRNWSDFGSVLGSVLGLFLDPQMTTFGRYFREPPPLVLFGPEESVFDWVFGPRNRPGAGAIQGPKMGAQKEGHK